MVEEASNGLPSRVAGKFGDKLTDKAVEKILEWAVGLGVGGAVAAFIRSEWACITKPWCTVSGPSLGALIAVTVVTTATALFLGRGWFRVRRELRAIKAQPKMESKPPTPRFQPITVEDHKLMLRWYIRRPPREWLHWRNVEGTIAPQGVHDVLDGPFHAAPKCSAPLTEAHGRGINEQGPPTFAEQCRNCGQDVFKGYSGSVWRVRAQALEELQRMERLGTTLEGRTLIDGPIVLDNPAYWSVMLPPPSVAPRPGDPGAHFQPQ